MAPDSGNPGNAATLARRAAIACAILAIVYVVAQLFEWLGLFGSAGGPNAMSTPLGLALLLTPSLLLGSAFLILMAALHQATAPSLRVWSQVGLAFATVYATLISWSISPS